MASYVTGGRLPTFRHSQAASETALFQSAVCMGGLLAAISFVLFATTARAQGAPAPQAGSGVTNPPSTTGSTNLTNQANNPVAPLPEILVQSYLMPAPQGYDGRPADEELLRLYWPFMVFGVQNILRVYQPIDTKPLFPTGRNAGFGERRPCSTWLSIRWESSPWVEGRCL
jgi:hypothetical protein